MRLPPGAAELRRHQWLDFRERRPGSLFPLFAALRSPEAAATVESLTPTPVMTSRFRAPLAARQSVAGCRNLAGVLPGFALVTQVFRPLEVQSTALAVVAGLLVLRLARLGSRVATRRITTAQIRRSCAVTCTVAVVWAGVVASVFWIPVTVSPTWGPMCRRTSTWAPS
ncbi:hypothetical protein [Streptomyces sp. MP131-18]|uniref:hypothetical protein n=1 Tax=Streptomyces sp. MP131-18 TaxID=1857892 RepID=UPI00097BAC38|nr:hypothetical protein [Streptomyces sp. MP131-18]ONK16105.1 hypothetical protein STBA_69550 [Streptomyces sp. MP131-18]